MMESCDDKTRPPVLVRREKRSSSTSPGPASEHRVVDTSRSPSPSKEHLQHVYPDVIIVERGTRASQQDSAVLQYTRNDDDQQLNTGKNHCHVSDVTDDDISASLKDYTYMYKKDDDACSGDKKVVDQTDHDAASDISSVSSSIIDYVRRSLTEVGVSTASGESRDELHPPPLPAKTTTQRRAPLHCEIHARQVAPDDVITNTWEPTHMTWDEVCSIDVSLTYCLPRNIG